MLRRRIGCHYYGFVNKVFTKNGNTSCWAGIKNFLVQSGPKYIYITNYEESETKKYQKLLVGIINEITSCTFLKRENVVYIKYKLLKNDYNRNLILLNFIRNLWDNPLYSAGKDYTKTFFEALENSKKKDPLERLTEANMIACKYYPMMGSDHSNAAKNVKVKSTKQLLDHKGDLVSTNSFLTT